MSLVAPEAGAEHEILVQQTGLYSVTTSPVDSECSSAVEPAAS
jgi:hypothetical protein